MANWRTITRTLFASKQAQFVTIISNNINLIYTTITNIITLLRLFFAKTIFHKLFQIRQILTNSIEDIFLQLL